MAAGSVPLLQALKYSNPMVGPGVVDSFIEGFAPLEEIATIPFAGSQYEQIIEGTIGQAQFRNVNEGYATTHSTDRIEYWGTGILGNEAQIDNYLWRVADDVDRLKMRTLLQLAKSVRLRLTYEFFKGDGSLKGFKGFETLVDEGHGKEHQNTGGAGPFTLEDLDIAIDLMRGIHHPSAINCNRTIARKITWRARDTYTGYSLIDTGTDVFGRRVKTYDGVPIRIVEDGMDAVGNVAEVLDFGEGSSTTSVYLTAYNATSEEPGIALLLGAGGSFDANVLGEMDSAPAMLARVELYPGLAVFDPYSLVRYSNITAADPS